MKEVIGLDVGERRIGVARGSLMARLAEPVNTIDRQLVDPIEAIKELIEAMRPNCLVVGLPRNLNGEDTPQTVITRDFGKQLQAAFPNLPIVWQDEALTSKKAEKALAASKKPSPGGVDALAATYILQDYLDNVKSRERV